MVTRCEARPLMVATVPIRSLGHSQVSVQWACSLSTLHSSTTHRHPSRQCSPHRRHRRIARCPDAAHAQCAPRQVSVQWANRATMVEVQQSRSPLCARRYGHSSARRPWHPHGAARASRCSLRSRSSASRHACIHLLQMVPSSRCLRTRRHPVLCRRRVPRCRAGWGRASAVPMRAPCLHAPTVCSLRLLRVWRQECSAVGVGCASTRMQTCMQRRLLPHAGAARVQCCRASQRASVRRRTTMRAISACSAWS